MNSRDFLYLGPFLLIFLLSQDYLFYSSHASTGFLGLPDWIFYFAGLHGLLALTFLWFQKKYWK